MARTKECKSDEKTLTSDNLDITSLKSVLDTVLSIFSMAQKPATMIPPPLLLIGSKLKPGMSGRNLAADIITEMEAELGISMTDIATFGEPNAAAGMIFTMAKNIVGHIQDNANVQGAFGPSSININGMAGIYPVVATNTNITTFNSSIL